MSKASSANRPFLLDRAYAHLLELVDKIVLEAIALWHEGSSPSVGTKFWKKVHKKFGSFNFYY